MRQPKAHKLTCPVCGAQMSLTKETKSYVEWLSQEIINYSNALLVRQLVKPFCLLRNHV